ncbi:hypothetical protein CKO22_11315 [Thiococcus pfennigii]|nr:hypothetical protein [Thiococcus pfennigii]
MELLEPRRRWQGGQGLDDGGREHPPGDRIEARPRAHALAVDSQWRTPGDGDDGQLAGRGQIELQCARVFAGPGQVGLAARAVTEGDLGGVAAEIGGEYAAQPDLGAGIAGPGGRVAQRRDARALGRGQPGQPRLGVVAVLARAQAPEMDRRVAQRRRLGRDPPGQRPGWSVHRTPPLTRPGRRLPAVGRII